MDLYYVTSDVLVVLCNKILHLPKAVQAGDKRVWETCRTTERSVVSNGQEWTVQPNSFQRC